MIATCATTRADRYILQGEELYDLTGFGRHKAGMSQASRDEAGAPGLRQPAAGGLSAYQLTSRPAFSFLR